MRLLAPVYQALACVTRGDHVASKFYLVEFDPIEPMDFDRGTEYRPGQEPVSRRAIVTGGQAPRLIRLPDGAKIVIDDKPREKVRLGKEGIEIVMLDRPKRVMIPGESFVWIDADTALKFAVGRKEGFELVEPRYPVAFTPAPIPPGGETIVRDGAPRLAPNPVPLYGAMMAIIAKDGSRNTIETISFTPIASQDFESVTGHRLIQQTRTEPSYYVAVAEGAQIEGVGEEACIELFPGQGGAWVTAKTLWSIAKRGKHGMTIVPAEWKHTLTSPAVAPPETRPTSPTASRPEPAQVEKKLPRPRPLPPGQDSFQWGTV
jgi:hypothetical protein